MMCVMTLKVIIAAVGDIIEMGLSGDPVVMITRVERVKRDGGRDGVEVGVGRDHMIGLMILGEVVEETESRYNIMTTKPWSCSQVHPVFLLIVEDLSRRGEEDHWIRVTIPVDCDRSATSLHFIRCKSKYKHEYKYSHRIKKLQGRNRIE
jgi:hypothetical protein